MRPIRRLLSTAFRQQKPCKADHCLGGIAAGPKIVRTCRFQSRQATKPKRFRRSILRRKVVSDENPWGYGTPGHAFYTNVIAKNPATVQEALNLAKAVGIKDTQGHLKWRYTWDGAYLEVDGKSWGAKKE